MEFDAASKKPLALARRYPLRDASNRANIPSPAAGHSSDRPSSSSLDKRIKSQDGTVPGEAADFRPQHAGIQRVSALADSQPNTNRNSAISTTSTTSRKSHRKTHIGPWQLGKTLGKGSAGRVRLAKHAVTGQRAAIKILSKKSASMVQSQSIAAMDRSIGRGPPGTLAMPCAIEREVVVMKILEHPNVISLYDVWENRGELYLVLEYVEGGELFDYLSNQGPLPEMEAVLFFRQLISAVACCHRFNICHRDLKPENILLDSKGNLKLADFGMAAFQPAGHWLTTSCGSPHYASPEIIYGRKYKGDKADIWSCGVILFAMLAGFLPFDGGDMQTTLKHVKQGEYIIPYWFSPDATDLIQRILQMQAEERITIQEILTHPLLAKYEKHPIFLNISRFEASSLKKLYIDFVVRREDIDMEVVRSLRTLWHDATPEQLVEKLLHGGPNHVRQFYKALVKFRDEQMESCDTLLVYSASDHHHVSRPFSAMAKRTLLSSNDNSHFTALPDASLVDPDSESPSVSYDEPRSARTMSSYDPYRSSHIPLSDPQADFANVTIHRGLSKSVSCRPSSSAGPPYSDFGASLNVGPSSVYQSSNLRATASPSFRRSSIVSFQSYSSMGSTRHQRLRSTPRSSSYKRNVSFRHLHAQAGNYPKRKRVSHAQSQYSLCPDSSYSGLRSKTTNRLSSSPSLPTPPPLVRVSKVPNTDEEQQPMPKLRLSRQNWKDEARKVSLELGKICEEAFNRPSLPPSSLGTDPSSRDRSETPPTSISIAETPSVVSSRAEDKAPESSASYAARELAETRKRLVEHSNNSSADCVPAYLSEVIAHLDRLLATEGSEPSAAFGSGALPPLPRQEILRLPPITEENDGVLDQIHEKMVQTGPSSREPGGRRSRDTIRLVSPDPPPGIEVIKPLNIRKKTSHELPELQDLTPDFLGGTLFDCDQRLTSSSPANPRSPRFYANLEPIDEVPDSPRTSEVRNSGDTRKWSWFKHRSLRESEDARPPTPPLKDDSAVLQQHQGVLQTVSGAPTQANHMAEDKANKTQERDKGSRLMRFFGKKKVTVQKPAHELAREIKPDETAPSITSMADSVSVASGVQTDKVEAFRQPSQNWFAKILHLKPATKVLALNVSNVRARKEVAKILREWKKYGIEGVRVDKQRNTVSARVGELNFLRLRPVEFSAEFFAVLEHGRNVGLSLIKVTQGQGATSSFNKVVGTLKVVLKQRKVLVEDRVKAKMMRKVLDVGK